MAKLNQTASTTFLLLFSFVVILPAFTYIFMNLDQLRSADVQQAATSIIWQADMEEGNMDDWYLSDGGGEFNSDGGTTSVSTEEAFNGRYSVKMQLPNAGSIQGSRLFRWNESDANDALYYSANYLIPQQYTVGNDSWWILMQWKARGSNTGCTNCTGNDPVWVLVGRTGADGKTYIGLEYWPQPGRISYSQTIKEVPIGHWFHLETYYKKAYGTAGQITVWQDDTQIFNKANVNTYLSGANDLHWAITNYAYNLNPSNVTTYIDNAAISTSRIGNTIVATPTSKATTQPSALPTPTLRPSATPGTTKTPTPTPRTTTAPSPTKTPGSIPSSSPSPVGGSSSIRIYAQGTHAEKVYPTMQLFIDDTLRNTYKNVSSYKQYTYAHPTKVKISQIRIAFPNDKNRRDLRQDRNLKVDKIILDGVTYQTEASSVYSVGSWNSATKCNGGYKKSEWLNCNGYFQF